MRLALVLLFTAAVFGQAPKRLEFEVASVRPAGEVVTDNARTPANASLDREQIRLTYLTMRDFITRAYRVRAYQVIGPDWIISERYDINATLPVGATTAQVPEMLQALLEDRFGLKIHKSQKEFTVYTLERNKRPFTLQEVEPRNPGASGVGVAPGAGNGIALNVARGGLFTFADNKMEGKGVGLDVLANQLTAMVGLPTMNGTDLKGVYDFRFDVDEEDFYLMMSRAAASRGAGSLTPELEAGSPDSFFNALDKVGLKLEKGKAPLEVINIDALKKMPTEN